MILISKALQCITSSDKDTLSSLNNNLISVMDIMVLEHER